MCMYVLDLAGPELQPWHLLTGTTKPVEFGGDREEAFSWIVVAAAMNHDGSEHWPASSDLMQNDFAWKLRHTFAIFVDLHR